MKIGVVCSSESSENLTCTRWINPKGDHYLRHIKYGSGLVYWAFNQTVETSTQNHSAFILYILPFLCSVMAFYGEPTQARDTVILITSGARKRRLDSPRPNPLLRQIFGFYRPQYFSHPHPEFVKDWPAPRKILSCKFLHLKLRTLMKKSDSTSRIPSWIQKLHSSRTLLITSGTNLTERRAEEKEEYGYIPSGVKIHRSRFG
jgi:hypothetical protein